LDISCAIIGYFGLILTVIASDKQQSAATKVAPKHEIADEFPESISPFQ
jgi:hypothetical protein